MASSLLSAPLVRISAAPFTPESFLPFGTAIEAPLPKPLSSPPSSLASLKAPNCTPEPANQGSALKWSPISPISESYGTDESKKKGSARMSMFSCFPRELRGPLSISPSSPSPPKAFSRLWNQNLSGLFDVKFLERHPYTSQTFIPLSTSESQDQVAQRSGHNTPEDVFFLIIVAPTLNGQTASATTINAEGNDATTTAIRDPPDLNNIQAFIAKPGQAVTYAAGTWHAPMVVMGRQRIDFVVVQYVNGIENEDCELVELKDGVVVEVDARSSRVVAKL
ncbi:hypothetical protein FQN49_001541 [Arthroderma sp. PD_2]|nr:hypothetical protein FQN49_001541 [Arthroderma sp. PD_2]